MSIVEKQVESIAEKLIGGDENLKSIVKIDLLRETYNRKSHLPKPIEFDDLMEKEIQRIKLNNEWEAFLINEEMQLTYDKDGNIVPVTK